MRRPLVFALLALALPAGAQAPRPAPPDTLALPAVTVTAARVPLRTLDAPARVTVLTRADADAAGAHSVADLLGARSAVFVRRYGPGGLASLSLRGTGASQTLVLLDGHRIADPQLGQLDLSLLPAGVFEGAEVLHGAASALYGTDGVGGAVNLRTGGAGRLVRLDARAGAWGERGGGLALREAWAPRPGLRTGALLALDAQAYEGGYAYTDSTRFNNETGTLGVLLRREGTDERRFAALGRAWAETDRARHAAGVWAGTAERGLFSYGAPGQARQWDESLRAWTDHTLRLGAVRVHAGALGQAGSLRWQGGPTAEAEPGRTRTLRAYARAERPVRVVLPAEGVWALTGGAEAGRATARHPRLRAGAAETSGALVASAVGDYGRVRLFPALRLDAVRAGSDAEAARTLAAFSPGLGLNAQPRARAALHVKAGVRRAFRTPTFNDRFWGEVGDPALRPERGWTADAGLAWTRGLGPAAVEAEATVFASALRDQLVWTPGADGAWRPRNVGQTRTRGWEASARTRYRLGPALAHADGLLTRTAARDVTDPASATFGQPLLYVPEHQAKGALALGVPAFGLGLDAVHTGRRYGLADGTGALAPHTIWGAHVRVRAPLPQAHATLALRMDNLTDRSYWVVRGYPMPPRHLSFRLTLTAR